MKLCTRVARGLVTHGENLGWPRISKHPGSRKNRTLSLSKAGWRCPYSPRSTVEGGLAIVPAVSDPTSINHERGAMK
jgi:hypothetical protein